MTMHPPAPLAELQAWMMRAIASGESDPATADRVLPSQSQSSRERLAVYQHAYLARLQECLRDSFPVLLIALGRETFDQFAAEYVARHPPASYTLNRLADRFVEDLLATQPADIPSPGWPDFLIELARLERTIEEVFDGPGLEDSPPLDASELVSRSSDQWSELRLVPAPCLRLLAFAFPIDDYYSAAKHRVAKQDQPTPSWPEPSPTWLAITRRDYIVRRVPLASAEFQVLSALIAGQTLAEALAGARGVGSAEVGNWFAAWGRLQFFRRLDC